MVIVNYFLFIATLAVATGVYFIGKIPTVSSRPYFVFLGNHRPDSSRIDDRSF